MNEKFFDSWTPESAYILGLLMADGTLNMPKKYYRDFVRGFFDGDGCVRCHRLSFCQRNGLKLFDFLYNGVDRKLRLSRKYKTFRKAVQHFGAVV